MTLIIFLSLHIKELSVELWVDTCILFILIEKANMSDAVYLIFKENMQSREI